MNIGAPVSSIVMVWLVRKCQIYLIKSKISSQPSCVTTISYLRSTCLTSPYLTLPRLTPPYLTLPYRTSHYLTLPYSSLFIIHCLTSPCLTSLYLASPHLALSRLTSPHIVVVAISLTSNYSWMMLFYKWVEKLASCSFRRWPIVNS